MSTTEQGKAAEDLALGYLEKQGLRMVNRNYRCRLGEIDLIMRDDDQLVFVEVRSRRRSGYGSAAETVTTNKQRRLIKTALHYMQRHRVRLSCRFDVVGINHNNDENTFDWIKNAFQAN